MVWGVERGRRAGLTTTRPNTQQVLGIKFMCPEVLGFGALPIVRYSTNKKKLFGVIILIISDVYACLTWDGKTRKDQCDHTLFLEALVELPRIELEGCW
jgi:hypothetical protein